MPATDPQAVMGALAEAMNAHDIEAFVALFADGYDSEQPAHPDRAFGGREQVRANWSSVFAGVPDVRAELVATTVSGDTAWAEWRWRGTGLDMAGVTIFVVRDGRIASGRLYMEPVEQGGAGIDAVRDVGRGRDRRVRVQRVDRRLAGGPLDRRRRRGACRSRSCGCSPELNT